MISFFTGPMYSGKSTALIEILLREPSPDYNKYLFVRASQDNRSFITHDKKLEARLANSRHNIEYKSISCFSEIANLDLNEYRSIFIDEIHLYDSENAYDFFKNILKSGIPTYVSGISGSSEQKPFETTSIFFPFASDVKFLQTKCYKDDTGVDHDKASYTKWISSKHKKNLIHVGDSDYVAVCGKCLNH